MPTGRGRPVVVPEPIANNGYRVQDGRAHLASLKHWHSTIVDYLLVNPSATNKNIGEFFGVHPFWVGRVRNTDAFREYYSMRMQEHRGFMSQEIVAKMEGVASKALDKISEKLDSGDVAMSQLQSAAEMSLKALGYGQRPAAGVQVNVSGSGPVQVMSVSSEALEQARKKLAARRAETTKEIEATKADYAHVTACLDVGESGVVSNPSSD